MPTLPKEDLFADTTIHSLSKSTMSLWHTDQQSQCWEPVGKELEILEFCLKGISRVNEQLRLIYIHGNGSEGVKDIDLTVRRQKRLLPAKNALNKIIRAIRKRDYMLLSSDEVHEVKDITPVLPKMESFHTELIQLRKQ